MGHRQPASRQARLLVGVLLMLFQLLLLLTVLLPGGALPFLLVSLTPERAAALQRWTGRMEGASSRGHRQVDLPAKLYLLLVSEQPLPTARLPLLLPPGQLVCQLTSSTVPWWQRALRPVPLLWLLSLSLWMLSLLAGVVGRGRVRARGSSWQM